MRAGPCVAPSRSSGTLSELSCPVLLGHTPGNHWSHRPATGWGLWSTERVKCSTGLLVVCSAPTQPSLGHPWPVLTGLGCPCTDSLLAASSGILEKAEAQVPFVVSAGPREAPLLSG